MQYIFDRLKERSTWLGLVTLLTGFGVQLQPEVATSIITIGSTVAGAVAVFTKDRL